MSTSWQTKLREAEKLFLEAEEMLELGRALSAAGKERKAEAQLIKDESTRLKKLTRQAIIEKSLRSGVPSKEVCLEAGISRSRLNQIIKKKQRIEEAVRKAKEKNLQRALHVSEYGYGDLIYNRQYGYWRWDDRKEFREIGGERLHAMDAVERLREKNATILRARANPKAIYLHQCAKAVAELMK